MRKITWLIITCLVAALLSFSIVKYPGIAGFFVNGYLIKMPLWFFIVICLVFLGAMSVLLKLVKTITLGPKKIYQRSRKIQQKKQLNIVTDMLIASIVKDPDSIQAHYGKKFATNPMFSEVIHGLYWQYLYQGKQFAVLGTLLKKYQTEMSDCFIWRYYQALLYFDQSKHLEAAALLTELVKKHPASQIISQKLIECHIHLLDYQRALQCMHHSKATLDLGCKVDLILRIVNNVHHAERLQKLWQSLSTELKQQPKLITSYLSRLYQVGEQAKAISLLQKALAKQLSQSLIRLYFSLKDTDGAYEFIKSQWLKTTQKNKVILSILLLKALKYKDWAFLTKYLDHMIADAPSVTSRAQHALLGAALYDYQSMHSQALQLKAQAQQLLLDAN